MRPEANGEANVIYALGEFHLALQVLRRGLFGSAAGLKRRLIAFAVLMGALLAAADHRQMAKQGRRPGVMSKERK